MHTMLTSIKTTYLKFKYYKKLFPMTAAVSLTSTDTGVFTYQVSDSRN